MTISCAASSLSIESGNGSSHVEERCCKKAISGESEPKTGLTPPFGEHKGTPASLWSSWLSERSPKGSLPGGPHPPFKLSLMAAASVTRCGLLVLGQLCCRGQNRLLDREGKVFGEGL